MAARNTYIKTASGWEQIAAGSQINALDDVGDVTISSVTDNELLVYESTTSQWINQTPAETGLAELSGATFSGNISAANVTTNLVTANNVAINVTSLATSGTINLDFDGAGYRTMANITGTTTFTASNYGAGETVTVRIINGSTTTARTINFPAGWVFVGPKPTTIAASKTGILSITSFGTTEADCVAAWAVTP